MTFGFPAEPYEVDPEVVRALDMLLILHADHEQNCSTSTVRLVGSSQANLFTSISGGINALWGPLHGGANHSVLEMLEKIREEGGDVREFVSRVKNREDGVKLMGFGHRVYKNYDPRARIVKEQADKILGKLGGDDDLLGIARALEEAALTDEYFIERKLYPNVDFYTGLIYRAIGFPTRMFTVMFALGRLPGWIAHWREMHDETGSKIGRPRQVYTGYTERDYAPFSSRFPFTGRPALPSRRCGRRCRIPLRRGDNLSRTTRFARGRWPLPTVWQECRVDRRRRRTATIVRRGRCCPRSSTACSPGRGSSPFRCMRGRRHRS
jgi:citrate synthase